MQGFFKEQEGLLKRGPLWPIIVVVNIRLLTLLRSPPLIRALKTHHSTAAYTPISCGEIVRHLNKLDARTCTGEDGIPNSLLKTVMRSDLRFQFCQTLCSLRSAKRVEIGRVSFIPKSKTPV